VVPAAAAVVAQLSGRCDDVSFHLSDGKNDTLFGSLRSGALDIVVGVLGRAEDGLEATLIAEDEMLLVAPKDHPLSASTSLPWSALEGSEIVHFVGGSIGELSAAAMRQNNLTLSTRYKVDQVSSLLGLAGSGLAVGVLPRLYTRGLDTDRVRLVPLVQPQIKRKLMLFHRSKLHEEHPRAAALCALLVPALRDQLAI
jgi:DNA-binding transcriptional LysR family regulator